MAAAFFRGNNQLWQLPPGPTNLPVMMYSSVNPNDFTAFNDAVWFAGTASGSSQLYQFTYTPNSTTSTYTLTQITGPGTGRNFTNLMPNDLTVLGKEVWFSGNTNSEGNQLFKFVPGTGLFQWTTPTKVPGGISNPTNLTVFDGDLWFNGKTNTQGNQLFTATTSTGSVTNVSSGDDNVPITGAGLDPQNLSVFQVSGFDNLWFSGNTANQGRQLFKSGLNSVVKLWTDPTSTNIGKNFNPSAILATFNDKDQNTNAFFTGDTGNTSVGRELFKLGYDGSVTMWTNSSTVTDVTDNMIVFNNALWFTGKQPGGKVELYNMDMNDKVTRITSAAWTRLTCSSSTMHFGSAVTVPPRVWGGNCSGWQQALAIP